MIDNIYPFPSDLEWEELLLTLFYKTNERGERLETFDISKKFENEVFFYSPNNDGECNCGFSERQIEIYEMPHSNSCPTKYIYSLYYAFLNLGMNSDQIIELVKNEIIKMGYEYNKNSRYHYLCMCEWKEKVKKWEAENDHLENCSLATPNLYHKRTGFQLFAKHKNDGYVMNQNIYIEDFKQIIKESYQSLK